MSGIWARLNPRPSRPWVGVAELAWRSGRGEWNGDTLQGEDGIPVWGVAIIYLYRLKAKWGSFREVAEADRVTGVGCFSWSGVLWFIHPG